MGRGEMDHGGRRDGPWGETKEGGVDKHICN